MSELTDLSAVEAANLIAKREISAVELTTAFLHRIEQRNPSVRAFRHIDPDYSLAEAAKADATKPLSPLHGVPFAIKDVIDTADFPTEYGTPIHAGHRPSADAKCVALMRDAGAIPLGKLVTTEYAMFTPNETRHPLDPARTPGGSSSGTGAAVGDRMVPIAFGNQTAGSLIRPAAYCGTFGLKPTHGTTDSTGILPLQPFFDTLGYVSNAIPDIQAFYNIVSGLDRTKSWPPDRPPKIGVCETFQWSFAEQESRDALRVTADQLSANGCHVEALSLPEDYADLVTIHRRILYSGIAKSLDKDYQHRRHLMSARLIEIIAEGRATSAVDFSNALAFAKQCRETVNDLCFGDFDAIICPSTPGIAPLGYETGLPIFQVAWTLLGVPCLNLPVATGPHNMPVGVQLIGKRHHDADLLALGNRLMENFQRINLAAG